MSRSRAVVILAAGQGKRMRSSLPKVLHPIAGRPMLEWSIALGKEIGADRVVVVVSPHSDAIRQVAENHGAEIAVQSEPLGTGHAVRAAQPVLTGFDGDVVVLFADTPLVRAQTVANLLAAREAGAGLVALGFETKTPGAYGRLIAAPDGQLARIVEAKDASLEELGVALCNSGALCAGARELFGWLAQITPKNAASEYYLTDCAALARADGVKTAIVIGEEAEFAGANDRVQLAEVEATFQARRRLEVMREGATLVDPTQVWFAHDTVIGDDVRIEPGVFFGPGVTVERGVTIRAFSHIEGAHLQEGAEIGPFARIRPGSNVGPHARVGNFVEIKKVVLGEKAKVGHLTYLGDAIVGAGANIGAGTITCNYDGVNKYVTEIGPGAFIGSDTALVAPVKVGAGAFTGSGSVITKDVPDHALAIARERQRNIEGWRRPDKKT
jgi:bifunctional UDP-N-acetylglucosamine pyrophosphorylase / glucosamine-1-phosphate N-acetyltransferase